MQVVITSKAKNPTALHEELSAVLRDQNQLSKDCCDFVLGLMTVDQEQRMSASDALEHEWLVTDMPQAGKPRRQSSREARANMLSNLQKFKTRNALQRTAMLALAVGMDADELKKLNAAFIEMDTNKDGLISFGEFSMMLSKQGVYDDAEIKGQETTNYSTHPHPHPFFFFLLFSKWRQKS